MMKRLLAIFLFGSFLVACEREPEDTRIPVDTLFVNGRVATIDPNLSIASVMAISSNGLPY